MYDITLNSSLAAPEDALETYPAEFSIGDPGATGLSPTFFQAYADAYGDVPAGQLSSIAANARWAIYSQGEGFTSDPRNPEGDEDGTPDPDQTGTPDATGTPGTSTPPPTGTPDQETPTPPDPTATPHDVPNCDPPTVSQRDPVIRIMGITPPKPVVVGQGGSGGTINFRAVSYPVIYRWETRESETHTTCNEWGTDDDGEDVCIDEEEHTDHWCEDHVRIERDPIVLGQCRGTAELRNSSIAWIRGELQQKYPGAEVRHPNWMVGCSGSMGWAGDTCVLEGSVHFGFEDPGKYDVALHARTRGTIFTNPRSFGYRRPNPLNVYMMDSTLTQ
jgi:hypothetical protein